MSINTRRSIQAPPLAALLNEALTPLQFSLQLLQSPALALAPRGDGQRVLVWPGFGAGNGSTAVLRAYLRWLGYDAQGWSLGDNSGDVLDTLDHLKADLLRAPSPEPVSLIGWSLGGYLAREVARDCPHRVKRVITLGSPVIGGPKYTAIAHAFSQRGQSLDEIERLVDARYAVPLTAPVTAIYSKADGVVAWQACIDERSPNVQHVEVFSSHAGLGFSPHAYRIVANRLASADDFATTVTG
ncbi:MAG: alpha/beta hydrolase [Gammaproteobacteria bacterium]|nr:alpha/beta hydrolase [Gammaproteobacteria bacterium]